MAVFSGTAAIYATAVSIGMLHGVEPGHGWPVAAVFALRRSNRWWYGIWAAVILAAAHLTSSFAVVAVYALADRFFDLHAFQWMNFVAGGLLLLMAVHQWRSAGHQHHHGHRHDHDHHHHDYDHHSGHHHGHSYGGSSPEPRAAGSLLGLVGFAFALGFVHEEEFAIIALAAGRANPWLVMGIYALAVGLSLVLLTIVAIATLNRFDKHLARYQERLPRVSAVILGGMGVAYLFRLF